MVTKIEVLKYINKRITESNGNIKALTIQLSGLRWWDSSSIKLGLQYEIRFFRAENLTLCEIRDYILTGKK